jgi:hypothetical protein
MDAARARTDSKAMEAELERTVEACFGRCQTGRSARNGGPRPCFHRALEGFHSKLHLEDGLCALERLEIE